MVCYSAELRLENWILMREQDRQLFYLFPEINVVFFFFQDPDWSSLGCAVIKRTNLALEFLWLPDSPLIFASHKCSNTVHLPC